MRNMCLKLAASLLVLVATAGPAAADHRKNYPGLMCLASTSVERVYWNGRANNPTSTEAVFHCPAIKEQDRIAGAKVYVVDRNSNAQVTCALRSGRVGGTALWAEGLATGVVETSDVPIPLTFSSFQDPAPVDPLGFYWLSCWVPGVLGGQSSGIVMYQIDEEAVVE